MRWVSTAAAAASTISKKISPSLVYIEDPSKTSSLSLYSLRDRKIHPLNPPNPRFASEPAMAGSSSPTRSLATSPSSTPPPTKPSPLPKLSTLNNVTPLFNSAHRLIVHRLILNKAPVTVGIDPYRLPTMLIFRTIVISNTNNHGDFTVFLVLLSPPFGLAYAKRGDANWITVDFSKDSMFLDVIRHNKRIYTVMGIDGRVCAWKFGGMFPTRPKLTLCVKDEEDETCKSRKTLEKLIVRDLSFFLVISPSGDVLRVRKERNNDDGKVSIKLHKLECNRSNGTLVEVKSLDENALLLGSNSAICIPAVDVPGLKDNNAYSEDHLFRDDVGVYIMEHESSNPIPLPISTYPPVA